MKSDRVSNEGLLNAGLELMRLANTPLVRVEARGRAMIYQTPAGETVRVRTCNDHLLVVLAESTEPNSRLNVEGTDFVLIVMPETPRSAGTVMAFLVPANVVAKAARDTHASWLASNPNTKGKNRTWNLWFDDSGPAKANGYANIWKKYRLNGEVDTTGHSINKNSEAKQARLGEIISIARKQISDAAGVPEAAVKISIDLT
jgi:hypothetical protein